MEEAQLQYFRKVLIQQLDELQKGVGTTVTDLLNRESYASEPVDRAQIEIDRGYLLRIRSRESRLINKIKESLKDIENGVYGLCEMCGREISVSRLIARPVARHCIECKRKMEKWEKASGW